METEKEQEQRRKDKEREDIICRAEQEKSSAVFEGSLNSKSKAHLKDIGFALGLDIDAAALVLKSRINDHFDEHPSLKQDPHYIGLFSQKWKCMQAQDENNLNP